MRKIISYCIAANLLSILFLQTSFAQLYEQRFQMDISPTYYPVVRAAAMKSNGNNLIAIHQQHLTGQGGCAFAEITPDGDTVWVKTFKRAGTTYGENYIDFIKELPNKQIFMAGGTHYSSGSFTSAFWLADSNGNILIYKEIAYNTYRMVTINDVDMASDGSIFFAANYFDLYSGGVSYYSWTVPIYGRLNANLTVAWARTWGSTNHTSYNNNRGDVKGIRVTPDNNYLIVVGTDAVHNGNGTMQLAKVSLSGTLVWRKQRPVTGYSTPVELIVAPDGEIYCYSILYNSTPYGGYDFILEKFSSAGNLIWSKSYGTTLSEQINRVAFNTSNHQMVVAGSMDLPAAENRSWLAVIDTAGTVLNSRLFGEPSSNGNSFSDVAITANQYLAAGTAYTYGAMLVQTDWTGATGCTPVDAPLQSGVTSTAYVTGVTHNSISLTEEDHSAIYIHPLLTSVRTCYTCSDVMVNTTASGCGSYFVGGAVQTTSGIYYDTLQSQGGCDSIIVTNLTIYQQPSAAYAGQDQHICTNATAISATPPAVGSGHWTVVSGSGSFVNANLPGTGINGLAADTNILAWTVSNGTCTPTYDEVMIIVGSPSSSLSTASACGSYTFNAQVYDSTGVYQQILPNAEGCDSTLTLNLTINPVYAFTDYQSICDWDTAQWHGMNYTANGTYHANYTSVNGCDSNYTLYLTVNPVYAFTENQSICDGETYHWQGNDYDSAGMYMVYYSSIHTCDSNYTLNLTVNIVDVSTSVSDPMITANAAGAAYQWLDCTNTFASIPGETGQSFTALANGSYAVEVTENGCVDTSACFNILTVGMSTNGTQNSMKLHPNPTRGVLYISSDRVLKDATLILTDATGRLISLQKELNGKEFTLDISVQTTGIYFLELSEGKSIVRMKVIKD